MMTLKVKIHTSIRLLTRKFKNHGKDKDNMENTWFTHEIKLRTSDNKSNYILMFVHSDDYVSNQNIQKYFFYFVSLISENEWMKSQSAYKYHPHQIN